jgi:sulfur carrier protein
MRIRVNGTEREAPPGATVASFLDALGLQARTVVVEWNGRILARREFAGQAIREGDQGQVVHFVGGG